jgi:hypothetical protein
MMRTQFVRYAATAAVVATLAGCGSDSPTGPGDTATDLAPVLAEISTGSAASFSGAPVGAVSAGSATAAWVPSSCAFSSSTKAFACPAVTLNGVTIARSFFLYDASGTALSAWDPKTTASVRTVTDVSGTLSPPPNFSGSINVSRHDDITLSGLLTGTHTLNGAGSGHSDAQLTNTQGTNRLVVDETSKTTNLVLPGKGANSVFPQSGTIELNQTLTVTLGSNAPTTAMMREVFTFDGTSVVSIDFTVGGTTRNCKLNLANFAASVGCSV